VLIFRIDAAATRTAAGCIWGQRVVLSGFDVLSAEKHEMRSCSIMSASLVGELYLSASA